MTSIFLVLLPLLIIVGAFFLVTLIAYGFDQQLARVRAKTVGNTKVISSDTFTFWVRDREVMRIEMSGKVFVRGKEVADDREVFENFKQWLSQANYYGGDIK